MALSNTVTYKDTRDQLITDSLLDVGAVGLGQTIEPDLINFTARKLERMIKAWMADGLNLWKIKETTLFLQRAQNYYQLGPSSSDHFTTDRPIYKSTTTAAHTAAATTITVATTAATTYTPNNYNSAALAPGMKVGIELNDNSMLWTTVSTVPTTTSFTIPGPGLTLPVNSGATVYAYTNQAERPLAIWDLMRRDKQDNDVPVLHISRNELYTFGRKVTAGTPTNFFFNPSTQQQIPGQQNSELWAYVAPSLGTDRLIFNAQYPVRDMTSADTDFDFPQEWLLALQTNLSVLLGPAHGTTMEHFNELKSIAREEKQRVMDWDREQTSFYIQPEFRYTGR